MPLKIEISKGLNIPLKGKAEKILSPGQIIGSTIALKPTDFPNLTPKAAIKEGDKVKAGDVIFYDKNTPEIKFTSPVSGTLKSIVRGERRKILEFVIEADSIIEYQQFTVGDVANLSKEQITELLLNSGTWPFVRQRPYNIIANPTDTPKAIFISGFDSSPLAPDLDFLLNGQDADFQKGIQALKKLTEGDIHLTVNGVFPTSKLFENTKDVELHTIVGPHPAGNVGIQIHHIDPMNKGEVVWFIHPQDVLIIGRLFNKGIFDATRIIALTGSEVEKPRYYRTILGSSIDKFLKDNIKPGNHRYISGNVLTGTRIGKEDFLGFYHHQITVIPDGNQYEFMGWLAPGFNKFSLSRTFFSWLMPNKEYVINANVRGGRRALMITGNFEKVFPMDLLPMQLLKAMIIEDIDLMEKLGIYEVVEEDFALCEFVDTSKTDIQAIVRKGLDLMIKELN
ncbi:MAG TPA: NADH:ubiquinone reductase (Na(+)-transporting) subunit A [Marinilabiliales bacterium]|nr:MAG: NADH:ubiquinone reductase (Na(+)-transporting) subunit A [Bacteroidetes bacterium GWA2_40_14]OFX62500.1 MAG: NADH:ubiquinone reductase (Na(+)-transporting) subunit A [Bacteroidetes bacterium GWC2_40_13]OFX74008.1 MAG: NADH:ubiquinone reductase (Na(+)-transporting) subunit A [Bacteroidetes bacterium GWD2_40_43]OFX93157.1 MAG: NADH:ubiquinone reductase (Na(+)-transporting) subunit A [Bacteroidetes bacterium GWE2_40_63]OFY21527.1 MAG: NADH:ubiquinone reductase (Na(+)-transporting) subunit 